MKYFGGFSDRDDVKCAFQYGYVGAVSTYNGYDVSPFPREDKILLAAYYDEDYEGDAYVLFERGGKLWEVHGSHCSCNGLEGQWDPEETSWEYFRSEHYYMPRPVAYYEGAKQRLNELLYIHTDMFTLG